MWFFRVYIYVRLWVGSLLNELKFAEHGGFYLANDDGF